MKLLAKLKTPLLSLSIIGIVIVVVLLATRPRSSTTEPENTLNVLNWTSYIPLEVIKDFERETGIKVNYATFASNEEMFEKLSAVNGGDYDIILASDYILNAAREAGLMQKIDKAIECGACLITCNNVDEVLEILRAKGKHK